MKIVGKQSVDYVSKKTNQSVTGVTLHCVGTNTRVNGQSVETLFISSKSDLYPVAMEIPLNADISVSYNRYGSIDNINPVGK